MRDPDWVEWLLDTFGGGEFEFETDGGGVWEGEGDVFEGEAGHVDGVVGPGVGDALQWGRFERSEVSQEDGRRKGDVGGVLRGESGEGRRKEGVDVRRDEGGGVFS